MANEPVSPLNGGYHYTMCCNSSDGFTEASYRLYIQMSAGLSEDESDHFQSFVHRQIHITTIREIIWNIILNSLPCMYSLLHTWC